MPMYYSNPTRAEDPYALPDVEVFQITLRPSEDGLEPGWYWWSCLPGCLPDNEAVGPFKTEEEAVADAQGICELDYGHGNESLGGPGQKG
jgi:hypothetical protein